MTETQDAQAAAVVVDSGSFFGNLFNLYFEPSATFAKIFTKPRIVAIVLFQVGVTLAFTTVWLEKADVREMIRQQMEQNPRIQQMSTDQINQAIGMQENIMRGAFRFAPFFGPLVGALLVGGFLMFVFRFFMAAEVSFFDSVATAAWSFTAIALIHTPIAIAVFMLKGDWSVNPSEIVQANPTLFLDVGTVPRWLWAFLASLDLFSLWTVHLLATGYSVAGKQKWSTCLWTVGILWMSLVLAKVAFVAATT